MLQHVASLLAATALTASAAAQEQNQEKDDLVSLNIVYFTHHDCPTLDPAEPGASADAPIDVAFEDLWYATSSESGEQGPELAKYDCRWVRTSGYMTWENYYHYRGKLHYSAAASYSGGGSFYLENFASGSPVRSALARRHMTIVARFYSLCDAAARAEKDAGQRWWIFGPCHYTHDDGLMLDDIRVVELRDKAPVYLSGDANRVILESLAAATPTEHADAAPAVLAWAASLQKGSSAHADAWLAQNPKSDADDIKRTRDAIASVDSYESHLLTARNFAKLNLAKAPLQIFRVLDDDDKFDEAVGCICLEASCTDRWPLTAFDAEDFLGPAACITLERWNQPEWRW